MAEQANSEIKKFGTFTGVFTPTLLTILGVIMYVRMGWVVGNAGLAGALGIVGLALVITVTTSLSLASIATNTRIGAGGPYAIIRRSLGLEVGGAIGLPLYLSRPLGVAMYIIGFREGWLWIFPSMPALLVDAGVFLVLFLIAYRSADLAFRVQYLIMAVIALSLAAIFLSPATFDTPQPIEWFGTYPGPEEEFPKGVDFWVLFAVFFPATTGILAGANMSGDLDDPRKAIPSGVLWAVGLSSIIYVAIAVWAARCIPQDELVNNYNAVIDASLFPPIVLAGLLGATFSSALAGLVGGPRILMAMGQNQVLPGSAWLARTSPDGEPRNAMLLTGILTVLCVMVRDLNAIAPLVTMFFLITYAVINLVVLVESGLGLVSFRPTLRIPQWVPLVGFVGCIFAMFVVNPFFAFIAVGMVAAIYIYLLLRGVEGERDDVRSSIFAAVAEWAATRVSTLGHSSPRAWKPNLLVPVDDPTSLAGKFQFLVDVAGPEGSLKLLGIATNEPAETLRPRIESLAASFMSQDLFTTWSVLDSAGLSQGTLTGLQALQSAFFRPNVLFHRLGEPSGDEELRELLVSTRLSGVGVMLYAEHPKAGLGQRRKVTLWVQRAPDTWDPNAAFSSGNLNLNLLIGYRLLRSWDADIRIATVVADASDQPAAATFLDELCDLARLPAAVERDVYVGAFHEALVEKYTDLHVMGLHRDPNLPDVRTTLRSVRASCVFVMDSGRESALS